MPHKRVGWRRDSGLPSCQRHSFRRRTSIRRGHPPTRWGMCVCWWLAGALGNPPPRAVGREVVLDKTKILGVHLGHDHRRKWGAWPW